MAVASNADASNGDAEAAPKEPEAPKLPDFPTQTVTLGSSDVETGYVLQVELTSVGASVQSATLTDPRYPVAENPEKIKPRPQLRVVGNNLARDD